MGNGKNRIVFMFIYEHLKLGGIEKSLIDQIVTYHSMGIRIIWLRYGEVDAVYEPWKKILIENEVEIVEINISKKEWLKKDRIYFLEDEDVYAVSYEPADFARLIQLKEILKKDNIKIYYQVPHFEGRVNYLEDYFFSEKKRDVVNKKLTTIYNKWFSNGNLLFFSEKHIEEMNARYQIDCLEREDLIYKTPKIPRKFDYDRVYQKAMLREKDFRIVTVGRFEFPHKGYMFGLIDAFCQIKELYPQLSLHIIGYGINESKIKEYVGSLPDRFSRDIKFLGAISPQEIGDYFDGFHLNVSMAYSLLDGAMNGVVSIPARHYTYACEVYGYLSENVGNYLDDRPGEPINQYIIDLINMDNDKYVDLCKESYEFAISTLSVNPNWLFEKDSVPIDFYSGDVDYIIRIWKHHVIKAKIISTLIKISHRLGIYTLLKKIKDKVN